MNELERMEQVSVEDFRQQVETRLMDHYSQDTITIEEYERRLGLAQDAQQVGSLMELVADLPALSPRKPVSPSSEASPVALNTGKVRESQTFITVFGGTDKKGKWRPARSMTSFTCFGGTSLDFTQAEFPPGTTEIMVYCFFGGIDIRVPDGVCVEAHGIPIFGGIDNKVREESENGPVLKITGLVLFGGMDIKPAKKKKRKKLEG